MSNDENGLEAELARWKADAPRRRAMRAAIPRADHEQWNDYVDALQRDREALGLARSSGTLDVDELAEALDHLLEQMHFMARACRNSLASVPQEIRHVNDYVRPWRRVQRWLTERRSTRTDRTSDPVTLGYTNPLDPPHE